MLLWSKAVLGAVLIAVAALGTGCSSVARLEMKRAQVYEAHGKTESALNAYVSALNRAPQSDNHLRSRIYYKIGECLFRLDRLNEALPAYQRAATLDSSNLMAHLRLGEIFLAGGAADRAGEQAHAVLQIASANIDGLALLGAASSAAGNDDLAREAFKLVLQSDPHRVSIAVALADLYNRQDEVREARAVLQKATAAQPASSLPWLALGRLEEQEGNVSAAENSYRHAVTAENTVETNLRLAQFLERTARVDEAESVLLKVDGLRPTMPSAFADFKLLTGQPEAALSYYTTALRSPVLDRKHPPRWLVSAGQRSSLAAHRASLAARVVEADLQLSAKLRDNAGPLGADAAAKLHFAEYRSEMDPATRAILQTEMALADRDLSVARLSAQQAITLAPNSAAAHYIQGVVLFRSGIRTEARREWLLSLEEDAGYVPARLAMGDMALKAGDLAGAEEYVVDVVREEPANLRALNLFARVLLREKRFESAAVIARRAAVVGRDSAEPHIILGQISAAQGHDAAALGEFERAISLDPYSGEALTELTRTYQRGEVTPAMVRKLERAAEMAPASAPLMEIAGRIYAQQSRYADARRCFVRSLQIDPGRKSALAMLASVQAASGDHHAALLSGEKLGGSNAALLSASIAERDGDIQSAIRAYRTAVRHGDASGVAANNLAWILAESGRDLDQALAYAQKASSLAPGNPSVLDTVGFVHLKRREYSKAIAVLNQANLLAARNRMPASQLAAIRQHLSEAYFHAGENAKAAALPSARPSVNR